MTTARVWIEWFLWRFFDRGRNPYLSGPACRTLIRGQHEWQDSHPIYSGVFLADDLLRDEERR